MSNLIKIIKAIPKDTATENKLPVVAFIEFAEFELWKTRGWDRAELEEDETIPARLVKISKFFPPVVNNLETGWIPITHIALYKERGWEILADEEKDGAVKVKRTSSGHKRFELVAFVDERDAYMWEKRNFDVGEVQADEDDLT